MNKNRLIPELRFPEFLNEEEWQEKELGMLAKKIVEKNKDGLIISVFTNSAIDGIVDQREYFDKDIADKNNLENYYIVEDGDYVYNPRISSIAPVGPISKNKTNKTGAISPLYMVFRFTDKNNGFYEYYFKSVHWYDSIRKASNTGARFDRMSITDSVFMDIPVLYPKPKEQQKIASCLSSLDEVISAHTQKLEALKEHKKGMMQNFFPHEGETVPKLRFPEFKNDGMWKENTLDEVATFLKGKGISKSDTVENGSLPCIRYGELYTHYNETISIIKSYTNLSADDLVLSKVNDVIIPASGETHIDIATASCVLKKGVALGGDLNIIRTKINGVFLSYYLNNSKRKDIAQMAQGISVVHLYPNQLKTLKINFPEAKEQQKIAECLSSLDIVITAQVEKIEQLKLHKKGLMQGLFPKVND